MNSQRIPALSPTSIKIKLLHANQLSEIPLANLGQTVCATDFDLTVKFPRFITNPKNPSFPLREGAILRGGMKSFKLMEMMQEQCWGYYLISAAAPSKTVAEALRIEMQNTYIEQGEKQDISRLFVAEKTNASTNEKPKEYVLLNTENETQRYDRCYIRENMILNDYYKAAGTVLRIKKENRRKNKISSIVFIDDFVMNAFYFPKDLIALLHNIKDKLADDLTIISVWLDPSSELEKNPLLKKIVDKGQENSNLADYKPYQFFFLDDSHAALSLDEYNGIIKSMTNRRMELSQTNCTEEELHLELEKTAQHCMYSLNSRSLALKA